MFSWFVCVVCVRAHVCVCVGGGDMIIVYIDNGWLYAVLYFSQFLQTFTSIL